MKSGDQVYYFGRLLKREWTERNSFLFLDKQHKQKENSFLTSLRIQCNTVTEISGGELLSSFERYSLSRKLSLLYRRKSLLLSSCFVKKEDSSTLEVKNEDQKQCRINNNTLQILNEGILCKRDEDEEKSAATSSSSRLRLNWWGTRVSLSLSFGSNNSTDIIQDCSCERVERLLRLRELVHDESLQD